MQHAPAIPEMAGAFSFAAPACAMALSSCGAESCRMTAAGLSFRTGLRWWDEARLAAVPGSPLERACMDFRNVRRDAWAQQAPDAW